MIARIPRIRRVCPAAISVRMPDHHEWKRGTALPGRCGIRKDRNTGSQLKDVKARVCGKWYAPDWYGSDMVGKEQVATAFPLLYHSGHLFDELPGQNQYAFDLLSEWRGVE